MTKKAADSISFVKSFIDNDTNASRVLLVTNYNVFHNNYDAPYLYLSGGIISRSDNNDLVVSHFFSDPNNPNQMPVHLLLNESGLDTLIDQLTNSKKLLNNLKKSKDETLETTNKLNKINF